MSVTILNNSQDLAAHAARLFVQIARESIRERGRFTVALAGGSTPEAAYNLLTQSELAGKVEWELCFFCWGDERFVPHDDSKQSNYAMADRSLLTRAPIPPDNIFPIPTDTPTVEEAAEDYAQTLRQFFGLSDYSAPPVFDLILLGLGDDGHTASLFPGMPSLQISDRWTAATPPGILPPPVDRITFTYPIINAARHIVFMVASDRKAVALKGILEDHVSRDSYPAAGVQPTNGELTWLLASDAASLLAKP
jgi:6-phosphogluconolactonase